jgi:EmrB/QacA subfamily drug resistance transporter
MRAFSGNTSKKRQAIRLVCVAQFVVVLDVTIVTTALPAIRQALGFSDAELQWVFTAYALIFGGLLIFGGRVADVVGRRRTFLIGLGLFAVASAGCALAWSPAALVAGRVLQGAGAALLSPAALALLTTLSEPGESRRRAVGWWTAVAAGGGATGWVLGGVISEYVGWRWVFAVNVPIGLVTMALALRTLPVDQKQDRAARLDLGGALTATAGLALLVYGLTSAGARGIDRAASWLPLLFAAIGFVIFVRHEERTADPLLPLGLLRSRSVAGANLTAVAITASTTPAMYLAVLYVQQVLGLPAARGSLLFPGVNLGVIAGSLLGPRLLGRLGARGTLLAGFGGIALGTTLLLLVPGDGLPVVQLVGAFAVMGLGLGAASVASTQTGTDAADPAYRGVTSGVLNSAAQVGTAVGVALLLPLAAAIGLDTMTGYRIGWIGAGAIALAGALAGLLVPAVRAPKPKRWRHRSGQYGRAAARGGPARWTSELLSTGFAWLGRMSAGVHATRAGGPLHRWTTTRRCGTATGRLDEIVAFYRDGLGLPQIDHFTGHAGYDGVMLDLPGTGAHLEFTATEHTPPPTPYAEDLLVRHGSD